MHYFLEKKYETVKNIRVSIIKILEELNNLNNQEIQIEKINLFIDYIEFNFDKLDINYINVLLISFVKKLNKSSISLEKIKKLNLNLNDNLLNISAQRFVNKLFRN